MMKQLYWYLHVSTQTVRAEAALREAEIDKANDVVDQMKQLHDVVDQMKQLLDRLNK